MNFKTKKLFFDEKTLKKFPKLSSVYLKQIKICQDIKELEKLRIAMLGRKGVVTLALKALALLPAEQRPKIGKEINNIYQNIVNAINDQSQNIKKTIRITQLKEETIDISLPARPSTKGVIHPISQVIDEITAIFVDKGFSVVEGPDIESDTMNFSALNFPADHPARNMHDTFYIADTSKTDAMVLRTHTSPIQIRAMQQYGAPLRIIAPGRAYRSDCDMTHSPMFHQVEGLVLEQDINFTHLKGCLIDFCKVFFEIDNLSLRFRPSYFPFTEPSAEIDIGCLKKDGRLEIGICEDWMEILGCGMVHPCVIKRGNLDPNYTQGFAFGMGVERLAMLKYGLSDLRSFFEGDQNWSNHYGFSFLEFPSIQRGLRI